MDTPLPSKRAERRRKSKHSPNPSSAPPPKDAYARLLAQHHSSKFRAYLEQYIHESPTQADESGPASHSGPSLHSDRVDVPQAAVNLSDSSDFSPSSLKGRCEESALSLYMEKLSRGGGGGGGGGVPTQDADRKQGVAQRRGPRRDTATSHDGDVDSAEENGSFHKPNDAKQPQQPQQQQKPKKKGPHRDSSHQPNAQNSPLHPQDQEKRKKENQGAEVSSPKAPLGKAKHMQRSQVNSPGDKNVKNRGFKKQVFEAYMSQEDVSHGLKRGQLLQGPLRINPKNYTNAFIPSPDGMRDIFLDGIVSRNRALNGDVVVVQVLPREQWKVVKSDTDCEVSSESESQANKTTQGKKSPQKKRAGPPPGADVVVEDQYSDGDDLPTRVEGLCLGAAENAKRAKPLEDLSSDGEILQRTAKVVYIVERKHSRAVTGFLKFLPDMPFAKFSPIDHRVPRINVPLAECPPDFACRPGDYANILSLAKSLGQAGEIEPETEGILMEYDVDFSEFPDEVLDCLPKSLPWSIPPEEMALRRDLRKECIFTIDPATARDLDDALSCKQLPDGNFEMGVHIADVSYFVTEGNALDAVASRRATSVYMVQKVIPMLPRLLCEELCSLNPLTDRLTFSVIWTLSPRGKILSEWFGRSVIRSCMKLSYDHAQSMIDAPDKLFSPGELPPCDPEHPLDEIHAAVLRLHTLAKQLREQRFEGGALRLDQLKLSFTLDKESMMPQGCYVYQYRDSNKLVEEFMLLANMAVANHIYRSFPQQAMLRRHPPPQAKMVDELQEFCDQMGLAVDFSSAGALHTSLHSTLGDDEYSSARKEVLTKMCSKPMQMALYFCTGALKEELQFRHYALNVPFYTHFTSPIRRYADVVVHRLLASSLGCGPRLGLDGDEVQKQASLCNDRKTASKRVQELSSELFFGECGPLESEAMVMGVLNESFDVLVLRYGVQKRIYCKSIVGLESFQYTRVGKKGDLNLVWAPESPRQPAVQQLISVFSLVEVQLRADEVALKYSAGLKRPQDKEP
ncbi:hypothetical protein NHX12_005027 [Muraenolepis orangiensis]|uniref:DIS3-like exonuclease 2 n=1 Tax=Muraenolepis orangiensis TaxID=630683 RepID=A0A9Q0DWF5_9TELE|nr:hypothetical protein NHX12_005027 [Muraenolepis orangiensis]